jgi:hypothetical protein
MTGPLACTCALVSQYLRPAWIHFYGSTGRAFFGQVAMPRRITVQKPGLQGVYGDLSLQPATVRRTWPSGSNT